MLRNGLGEPRVVPPGGDQAGALDPSRRIGVAVGSAHFRLMFELPATPMPSSRRTSCGTVILRPGRELLLCHVTGQNHWDLPKGGIDAGETPIEAALRETREETGVVLSAAALHDLGRLRYTAKKDLHLFAVWMPALDVRGLRCESFFVERLSGRRRPEMDGFAWTGFDEIADRCTANLTELLRVRVDLEGLLARFNSADQDALAA